MLKYILSFATGVFLLINTCFSQNQHIDIKKKVNAYLQHYAINDLYIRFNQPIYSPGDTAFFVIGSAQLAALEKSRELLTICLVDGSGKNVILKEKIILQHGLAISQLVFPLNLHPGLYQWVVILNRFGIENQDILNGTLSIVGKKKIVPEKIVAVSIEGNSLINGLACNIRVQLRNALKNQKVNIRNNEGGVVCTGVSDSMGYAKMTFVPDILVQSYTVSIDDPITSFVLLPSRQNTGWTLHELKSITEEGKRIEITTNDPSQENVSLVYCSRKEVLSVSTILSNEQVQIVRIPPHFEDIRYVLLLDSSLHVLAQLTISKSSIQEKKLDIQLTRTKFSTRDLVHLKITGHQEMDWLAVRVIKKNLFNDSIEHMKLVPNVEFYQKPFFSSQLKLAADHKSSSYQEIKGVVQMERRAKSLDSVQVMLFLQKSIFGYETFVDNDSHFRIPLVFNTDGAESAFYAVRTKYGDILNPRIDFEQENNSFNLLDIQSHESEERDTYGEYSFTKRMIEESFAPLNVNSKSSDSPNQKYEEELGGVDIIRKLEDYTSFTSIEDVIREILPAVEYRKKGERDVIRVFTTEKRPKDSFGPLYIIDGVFFKSPAFFVNLPIADVKAIKVVKDSRKLRAFGALGENGIIFVETKSRRALPSESLTMIRGVSSSLPSRIYTGNSLKNHRTPDLRSCLFWAPNVKLNPKNEVDLNFMTSDDLGEMIIQVEGETSLGEYILEERTIVVSFPN